MNKFARIFAKSANIWRGIAAVFLALLVMVALMSQYAYANRDMINNALGLASSKAVQTGEAEVAYHYKSDYMAEVGKPTLDEFNALKEDSKQQAIKEMEEGAILLKNDNNTLPLNKGAKISLFGHGNESPLYKSGSGGPEFKGINVKTALDAKFDVNDDLYNAYEDARKNKKFGSGSRNYNQIGGTNWTIYEPEKAFYDQERIRDTYEEFGDAAIVFITRSAGEHRDCPTGRKGLDMDGINTDKDYLELYPNEIDMLKEVQNGGFDKTILVLNTSNIFQVDWLDEYGIDACLYTAGYGDYGTIGLANILCGDANPSGRLVDTWAYDFMSAPAMTNFGNFTYTNAGEKLQKGVNGITDPMDKVSKYVVYAEGIYIGYKYYETRYEDVILGRGGADSSVGSTTGDSWNYAEEVQFPFGYGMSYTTFTQELTGSYDASAVGEEFTLQVTVTNTGDRAGKLAVPVYVQAPYVTYGVEKSAVQLVGFGKTDMIEPNGSDTVEIKVDKYLLASYDDKTGDGGYMLDAGDYYFAVGDSVHDALNYILAEKKATGMVNHDGSAFNAGQGKKVYKWNQPTIDRETYRYSRWSDDGKVEVKNRLQDIDINYWIKDTVTYLTRSNWEGTYPTKAPSIAVTDEMARVISGNFYEDVVPEDAPDFDSFKQGEPSTIPFVSMYGIKYNDPIWEEFLNQLSIDEMISLVVENWGSPVVKSVNKPSNYNDDGPDGVNGGFKLFDSEGKRIPGIEGECTMFVNETILASTYNPELIRNRGLLMGEESMFANCPQLWSPGANLHRTPYSGRNFEYYSECANMSYLCAGIEVGAMREKGVVTAIKHCCGNDQETNRQGVSTFSTEQAFRMNSMRGFEGAFTVGRSNSTMTAFNRVGLVAYPHHKVMQEDIMRGEWGFKGVIISDMITDSMHASEGLVSGNDMWCLAGLAGRDKQIIEELNELMDAKDGYALQNLRRTSKNFFYAYCNSNLTNGLSVDTKIVMIKNWWETMLDTMNMVLLVLTIVTCVLFVGSIATRIVISRKEKEA